MHVGLVHAGRVGCLDPWAASYRNGFLTSKFKREHKLPSRSWVTEQCLPNGYKFPTVAPLAQPYAVPVLIAHLRRDLGCRAHVPIGNKFLVTFRIT